MRDAVDTKRRTQLQSSITDAMAKLRACLDRTVHPT
jgi:hypothetical protein